MLPWRLETFNDLQRQELKNLAKAMLAMETGDDSFLDKPVADESVMNLSSDSLRMLNDLAIDLLKTKAAPGPAILAAADNEPTCFSL